MKVTEVFLAALVPLAANVTGAGPESMDHAYVIPLSGLNVVEARALTDAVDPVTGFGVTVATCVKSNTLLMTVTFVVVENVETVAVQRNTYCPALAIVTCVDFAAFVSFGEKVTGAGPDIIVHEYMISDSGRKSDPANTSSDTVALSLYIVP